MNLKLTLAVAGLIGMTLTVLGTLSYRESYDALEQETLKSTEAGLGRITLSIAERLRPPSGDVRFLSETPAVASFVRASEAGGIDPVTRLSREKWAEMTEALFESLIRVRPSYMQIRYVDHTGRERIRVDSRNGHIRIVPADELQDKSSRGYYAAAMQLPPGTVYVSPMELNREHGRIEVPHVPTVRFAAPVFNERKERRGFVIINENSTSLLAGVYSNAGTIYLVDSAGYYLHHPDASREFGSDLGTDSRIQRDHPRLAERMKDTNSWVELIDDEEGRQPHVHAFSKIFFDPRDSSHYWAVVSELPADTAFAAANDLRKTFLWLGLLVALLGAVATYVWAGQVTRPIVALADVADRIAGGDTEATAPETGSRELVHLGGSFNAMTRSLRNFIETERVGKEREREGRERLQSLLEAITETSVSLSSATSEIMAGSAQQAKGAEEQVAAVAQTTATVTEVSRTAERSARCAEAVVDSAQRAAEVGETGLEAVGRSVSAMELVKEHTGEIAGSILELAERAQAISEIIDAVNGIADQTKLLAFNAGIEASRAGQHGAGFQVVAREIKDLAERSKRATVQVRHILGEIQHASNSAVMTTEKGAKSVDETIATVNHAGETIAALGNVIDEAVQAAAQIAASAGQQATGMAQIQQAVDDIGRATSQNLASTHQAERTAQDLYALGKKLEELVAG